MQTPNRDRRGGDRNGVITNLYATFGPTLVHRAPQEAPLSARAVAVIRPGINMIALYAFLGILSGPSQLHAGEDEFLCALNAFLLLRLKPSPKPENQCHGYDTAYVENRMVLARTGTSDAQML